MTSPVTKTNSMPPFHWCCQPLKEDESFGEVVFHSNLGSVTIRDRTFGKKDEIDYTFCEVFIAKRTHAYEQSLEILFDGQVHDFSYDLRKQFGWWWFGSECDAILQIKNTATGEIWHFAWQACDAGTRRWHRLTPSQGMPRGLKTSSNIKRASILAFELGVTVFLFGAFAFVIGGLLLGIILGLVSTH